MRSLNRGNGERWHLDPFHAVPAPGRRPREHVWSPFIGIESTSVQEIAASCIKPPIAKARGRKTGSKHDHPPPLTSVVRRRAPVFIWARLIWARDDHQLRGGGDAVRHGLRRLYATGNGWPEHAAIVVIEEPLCPTTP